MSKVDSEDGWILFVIGVALAAFIIWKFSPYLGLDMVTGGMVLARLAVLVVVTGLSWTVANDFPPLRPRVIWPLLLSALWLCGWPALDFWAANGLSRRARFTRRTSRGGRAGLPSGAFWRVLPPRAT
jgi:hypothetical protein